MLLESLKYNRLKGKSKEWRIEGRNGDPVRFGRMNLIVGKNSAGKTLTLAVIREIAALLSGRRRLPELRHASACYDISFRDGDDVYRYIIEYENKSILSESLSLNGEDKTNRAAKQLLSATSGAWETVHVEDNELLVSLHEASKYPSLEKLYRWGDALKNTVFSNQAEKNFLPDDLSKVDADTPTMAKEPAALLHTVIRGQKLFGTAFTERIIRDMNMLGYEISSLDIQKIEQGYALCVQEAGMDDATDQIEMSQGMFRALSFLINLNFARMNRRPVCILIDDLGEGLDFNRSELLSDLLADDGNEAAIQLFITTNDRYIMNKFPLRYWTVIERNESKTVFYNYYNSQAFFDDFAYTGLSNFDFLATDFYIYGFGEVQEEEET
ncbi:MAG: ATP-binding protein [Prevotella sp.]|jgi:hypothetical protein|nr:ATP-binding protein [Prevotella sp.]